MYCENDPNIQNPPVKRIKTDCNSKFNELGDIVSQVSNSDTNNDFIGKYNQINLNSIDNNESIFEDSYSEESVDTKQNVLTDGVCASVVTSTDNNDKNITCNGIADNTTHYSPKIEDYDSISENNTKLDKLENIPLENSSKKDESDKIDFNLGDLDPLQSLSEISVNDYAKNVFLIPVFKKGSQLYITSLYNPLCLHKFFTQSEIIIFSEHKLYVYIYYFVSTLHVLVKLSKKPLHSDTLPVEEQPYISVFQESNVYEDSLIDENDHIFKMTIKCLMNTRYQGKYYVNYADFLNYISEQCDYTPPGQFKTVVPCKSLNKRIFAFSLYPNTTESDYIEIYNRFRWMLLFFFDTKFENDHLPTWGIHLFYVLHKIDHIESSNLTSLCIEQNENTKKCNHSEYIYEICGGISEVIFHNYPNCRINFDHFLILPQFRNRGIGTSIWKKIHRSVLLNDRINEIVIPKPTFIFTRIRCAVGLELAYTAGIIKNNDIYPFKYLTLEEFTSMCSNLTNESHQNNNNCDNTNNLNATVNEVTNNCTTTTLSITKQYLEKEFRLLLQETLKESNNQINIMTEILCLTSFIPVSLCFSENFKFSKFNTEDPSYLEVFSHCLLLYNTSGLEPLRKHSKQRITKENLEYIKSLPDDKRKEILSSGWQTLFFLYIVIIDIVRKRINKIKQI